MTAIIFMLFTRRLGSKTNFQGVGRRLLIDSIAPDATYNWRHYFMRKQRPGITKRDANGSGIRNFRQKSNGLRYNVVLLFMQFFCNFIVRFK